MGLLSTACGSVADTDFMQFFRLEVNSVTPIGLFALRHRHSVTSSVRNSTNSDKAGKSLLGRAVDLFSLFLLFRSESQEPHLLSEVISVPTTIPEMDQAFIHAQFSFAPLIATKHPPHHSALASRA